MCHIKEQTFSIVFLGGGADSASCQHPEGLAILLMHPSVLSNQQGDRLSVYTPNGCSYGSLVQCQTAGADVDTTRAEVLSKSWKSAEILQVVRCTIRWFWDWSPHHAWCWLEFQCWGQHWLTKVCRLTAQISLVAFLLPNCSLCRGSLSNYRMAQGLVGLRMSGDTQILAHTSPKWLFTKR